MTGRNKDYEKLFPRRHDEAGNPLCRYCGAAVPKRRKSFCSERCADFALIETSPSGYRHITLKYLGSACYLCEKELIRVLLKKAWFEGQMKIHHVLPVRDGGDNKLENLVGLCHECHMRAERLYRMVKKILDGAGTDKVGNTIPATQGGYSKLFFSPHCFGGKGELDLEW